MILQDTELKKWAEKGVTLTNGPFINPASIDLCLCNVIRVPMWYWNPITWRIAYKLGLKKWSEEKTFETYLMKPHGFTLCASMEITKIPIDTAALLVLKSSTGRTGVEHLHAGFGDPGFTGQWTWELYNSAPWPNELIAGKRLMQLVLVRLVGIPEKTYEGKYQHQVGPTPGREK